MKILVDHVDHLIGLPKKSWWLEISTEFPRCEYFFGPFESKSEAAQARSGYVEDLEQEGSKLICISIVYRLSPVELTVEYPEVMYVNTPA